MVWRKLEYCEYCAVVVREKQEYIVSRLSESIKELLANAEWHRFYIPTICVMFHSRYDYVLEVE